MAMYPKIRNHPNCLGFRKTVVLNKNEHDALNCLLDDAIQFCNEQELLKDSPTKQLFVGLQEKINAPTPPAN